MALLINIGECFYHLFLNEDAVYFLKQALSYDNSNVKAISLLAKSLAYLFNFNKSVAFSNQIVDSTLTQFVNSLQHQYNG